MNTKSGIFTRGLATRENTAFGVHSMKQKSILYRKHQISSICYFHFVLAHLSRRLIGELIVYEGIRRPSVRRPYVSIFKRHLL